MKLNFNFLEEKASQKLDYFEEIIHNKCMNKKVGPKEYNIL